MKKIIFIILVLVFSSSYASNDVINTMPLNTMNNQIKTTSTIVETAKEWHLTEEEWKTYKNLMQGVAGQYYSDYTPPEVLGILATNENELNHYAEIYLKLEYERNYRELRFNAAFHKAGVRLYGNKPIIKVDRNLTYTPIQKNQIENPNDLRSGDHLVLFVDVQGDKFSSSPLIEKIKNHIGVVLDIYCINVVNNSSIQKWANDTHIPLDLVSTQRVTLNNDNGKLKKLNPSASLPYLLLVRDGKSKAIKRDFF